MAEFASVLTLLGVNTFVSDIVVLLCLLWPFVPQIANIFSFLRFLMGFKRIELNVNSFTLIHCFQLNEIDYEEWIATTH